MTSRDSRDKKEIERFAPITPEDKGKGVIYEGSGTPLSKIPIIPLNLNKIDADHDLLKSFHTFLYGFVGKKTVRKKNIRSFSGFAEDENEVHETRAKKLKDSKKWTVTALKNLCSLLGLDKGGSKGDVADRIISFLASPDPAVSKTLAKKPKGVKRKSMGKDGKAKKVKRESKPRPKSGYMMFCQANRTKLIKDEGPMPPTEVTTKLAQMWRECSDADKEKYKKMGLEEFQKDGQSKGNGEAIEDEESGAGNDPIADEENGAGNEPIEDEESGAKNEKKESAQGEDHDEKANEDGDDGGVEE